MFSRDVLRIDPRPGRRADRGGHSPGGPGRPPPARGGRRHLGRDRQLGGGRPVRSGARARAGRRAPHAGAGLVGRRASARPDARRAARDPVRRRGHLAGRSRPCGCYERQDEAIRMVVPEYGAGWRCKIVLPSLLEGDRLNVAQLAVADPDGNERRSRMPPAAYLQMVAATNFKQRTRTMMAYYHADRLQFAVAGTPEPRRVRPGVLREAGRRGGGLQADRPPLQDPGLRARRVSRRARARSGTGSRPRTPTPWPRRRRSSTSPCRTPRWTSACGPWTTACRPREVGSRHRAHRGAGRAGLPRHRGEAPREPLPAPRARRR